MAFSSTSKIFLCPYDSPDKATEQIMENGDMPGSPSGIENHYVDRYVQQTLENVVIQRKLPSSLGFFELWKSFERV